MNIGSSCNLNNKVCFNSVLLNNVPIPQTGTHKCLGIEIDEKLSWDKHIETICKQVSAGIGAIRRAKPFVPTNIIYKPSISYGTTLF